MANRNNSTDSEGREMTEEVNNKKRFSIFSRKKRNKENNKDEAPLQKKTKTEKYKPIKKYSEIMKDKSTFLEEVVESSLKTGSFILLLCTFGFALAGLGLIAIIFYCALFIDFLLLQAVSEVWKDEFKDTANKEIKTIEAEQKAAKEEAKENIAMINKMKEHEVENENKKELEKVNSERDQILTENKRKVAENLSLAMKAEELKSKNEKKRLEIQKTKESQNSSQQNNEIELNLN